MSEEHIDGRHSGVSGGHMGADERLVARAKRGAEKVIAMGHSGVVTLESSILAQSRMNAKLQKHFNRLTHEKVMAEHRAAKLEGQLEAGHRYIQNLKAQIAGHIEAAEIFAAEVFGEHATGATVLKARLMAFQALTGVEDADDFTGYIE
jgi:hypothetical protein